MFISTKCEVPTVWCFSGVQS